MIIDTVGVIGACITGRDIAQACAAKGLELLMVGIAEAAVQRGLDTVASTLDRLVKNSNRRGRRHGPGYGAHPRQHRLRRPAWKLPAVSAG